MFAKPATEAARGPYSIRPKTAIQRVRQQKGMTQVQCAKFCRVSLRTFQPADAGDVVDRSTKRAIEAALGLWL